ncbi:MAG: T9SS type A sorting domain-containing protein [Gemmatimonadetes bacterium]|nr:T9SS type A sorting domain-containing protein [Gemmatimonadota bacterium]
MKLRSCFAALAAPVLVLGAVAGSVQAEPYIHDGIEFESREAFSRSEYFRANGLRCGTPETKVEEGIAAFGSPSDCTAGNTNILPEYDPSNGMITMQVVFHVIQSTGGSGNIPDSQIMNQLDIINEDFLAIAGTPGANGTNGMIQFVMATEDPLGNPTNGITRTTNNTWFNDGGSYWNSLAWDPNTYINIYCNSASGNLGYVPYLPQTGTPGAASDRVVVLWNTVGRNAPYGPPYDQGRTVTHELGHYFGLDHTFAGGCAAASPPNCYTTGDWICDTNSESTPTFGCPNKSSCSSPDPIDNYMDYSDDLCMEMFTPEQMNRMRCTIENWRPGLILNTAVSANLVTEDSSFNLLHQNQPNPFGARTEISFELPKPSQATLRVVDIAGRNVRTLTSAQLGAGRHAFTWDGTDRNNAPVAAGVYFYRLSTPTGDETRRMVKMK